MQSATFGPTPGNSNNLSLKIFTSFSFASFSNLCLFSFIILVVSYTLTSLNPNPSFLKSSTDALDNCLGVGKV